MGVVIEHASLTPLVLSLRVAYGEDR